ncbi:hypothetical protein AVEN_44764-1 [Araneus ventricosus]|uniref:Uncharacterized protein n=1 Tax=Araneus ventricosus TaxID=182803 RepID=A0A4Y2SVB7_ARAVE|nr:hypothetical protein AVEN_44764-1 [Araneus ventricosus]
MLETSRRKCVTLFIWFVCCRKIFGLEYYVKTYPDFDRKFSTSLLVQNNKFETVIITESCEANTSKELEKESFNYYTKNVENDKDGKFEVKIPWIRILDQLPTHKDIGGKAPFY